MKNTLTENSEGGQGEQEEKYSGGEGEDGIQTK